MMGSDQKETGLDATVVMCRCEVQRTSSCDGNSWGNRALWWGMSRPAESLAKMWRVT